MPIYEGQPVPLPFTLTDVNGNPQNAVATQPVVTVTQPDTTTRTPAVSNSGTGQYAATFFTTQAGRHTVAWQCTDATYPGGYADEFDVWPLTSTNVLSYLDAKGILNIAPANTTWDDLIQKVNASITEWLEWYCGPIVPQTVQEWLKAGGLTVQLSKPPVTGLVAWTSVPAALANATGFSVASANGGPMFPTMVYGVAYPLNQLYCDPQKGVVRHTSGLPFYYGPFIWQYTAGYSIVPYGIRYAADVTLRHLFAIERGGSGIAAAGAADEETTMTPFGFAVPNRAIEALAPHQLSGGDRMSVLYFYFGWPDGAVWSNLLASVICAGFLWWRLRARMIAHHAEQLAQAARHHKEHLAAIAGAAAAAAAPAVSVTVTGGGGEPA